jgi:hypothetical protein
LSLPLLPLFLFLLLLLNPVLLLLLLLPTASRQSSARIFTDSGSCLSNLPRSRRCQITLDLAIAVAT